MPDWIAAYNRLYPFLDGYTGSQFIKVVQKTDPDLLDYNDYIEKRRKEEKSTTKKVFFRDILLSYSDDIKLHLFETFLEKVEENNPDEANNIRTLINGGKVDISKAIYETAAASKEIDGNLVQQTISGLKAFPDTNKLYLQALKDFKSGKNQRHILDDLRLSLETFLRSLLGNSKSLENQMESLGKYQKSKGISSEITNTFHKILELFNKYQNEYVKHTDSVKPSEIEFIFNLTNTFFRFLLTH